MNRLLNLIFIFCIVSISSHLYAQGSYSFKIIVNEDNPVSSLSKEHIARLFLKKTTKWNDGAKVFPVDQSSSSRVRSYFSERILGKPVSSVEAYWQERIFSGRGVPPPEKKSNRQVVSYVKEHPEAVGYVSSSVKLHGVKEIKITK